MSELPEKQAKRLHALIQEAETNLAAAKELQRIIDVTKKTDDGGSEGGTTLIIEPIYGAPEAEGDE